MVKKYTWSNHQDNPTLTRIDRVFHTPDWEEVIVNPIIQPLSSSTSDHCPLLVLPLETPPITPRFRFESFWPDMPGCLDCVKEAWQSPTPANQNSMMTLHVKLTRTGKALKKWTKTLIPQGKLTMEICHEVILRLELAQEQRQLIQQETQLIKKLKSRLLGLTAIEKSRARQKSRLTWTRKGDANTKYFQLMANNRKKQNFIHTLQSSDGVVSSQQDKHKVIDDHFRGHVGTYTPCSCALNFHELGWQGRNLEHLELPFCKTRFWHVQI